jgi:hypothetical protein
MIHAAVKALLMPPPRPLQIGSAFDRSAQLTAVLLAAVTATTNEK